MDLAGQNVETEENQTLLRISSPQRPLSFRSIYAGRLVMFVLGFGAVWRADRSGGAEPQNPSRLPSADPLLGAMWIANFLGKEIPADLQELALLRSPSLAVPKRALGDLGRVIRVSRAKQELTEEQKLNTANCVSTIWDMLNYVGYAGLAIDALTLKGLCPDKTDDASCSANAIALVSDLAEILSNAAQTPLWCLPDVSLSPQVDCLVTMSAYFTSISQIIADALGEVPECDLDPKLEDYIPAVADFSDRVNRRILELQSKSFPQPPPLSSNGTKVAVLPADRWNSLEARILQDINDLGPDDARRNELGICAMSIMQVVNDYPSYAINIWSTVVDFAAKTKLEEAKKYSNKVGLDKEYEDAVKVCVGDALGLVGSSVNLATDLAAILAVCPGPKSRADATACTVDGLDITSITLSLGGWGATADQTCNDKMFRTPAPHIVKDQRSIG
ncbi:mtr4 [Symbiodinium sp. CCMP2592]|nr:mtr4 [Symbiodinium sp. CCMP2592]